MHLKKKLSRQKNSRFGKKLMVLAKKTRVTGIWQLSHYTENKKTQKTQKKLRKFPKKLTLPGFDSCQIPQKCTKIKPGVYYAVHVYYKHFIRDEIIVFSLSIWGGLISDIDKGNFLSLRCMLKYIAIHRAE